MEAAPKGDKEGESDDVESDSVGKTSSEQKVIMSNMGSELKLHWHLFFLHEGTWLFDEKKVCEKVELYDFK